MNDLHYGVSVFPQYTTWNDLRDAALQLETLGYDSVWTWDHFLPIIGDPNGPNFECWQVLSAWAALTHEIKIGALVSGNTYRHPAVLAKMAATLDHVSNGRAILGVGSAWFELEHQQYGIDFGKSPGDRLNRLGEALAIIRSLLDNPHTTVQGKYYTVTEARAEPKPVQKKLPIMIGGGGEQKTLRMVARYGDYWNGFGPPDVIANKLDILKGHCKEAGTSFDHILTTVMTRVVIRDSKAEGQAYIEKVKAHNHITEASMNIVPFVGNPEEVAAHIAAYAKVGIKGMLFGQAAPYDHVTLERLQKEVRPLVRNLTALNPTAT